MSSHGWWENKPGRELPGGYTPPGGGPSSSPSPSSTPAHAGPPGVDSRPSSAASLPPLVSFRCQLAQRLREAVGARSNRFVATITGYNEETVRRYLRDGGPSAEFLAAVCRHFGVSAEWLLMGIGPIRHQTPQHGPDDAEHAGTGPYQPS